MVRVSLVEVKEIETAVEEAISLLGGIDRFVKRGDRVLIKVNMFIQEKFTSGKITDPRLVIILAKMFKQRGAKVTVGERTKNIYLNFEEFPEIKEYAEVVSFDDLPHNHLRLENARALRIPIAIPRLVEECDVFVNVPGLRTHALTLISNAMKNLMGILPGEIPLYAHLCGLESSIVDLNVYRSSHLIISDAIYSVQGNFPTEGESILSNFILAGDNVVAVDAIAATILGFSPSEVEHLKEAEERGLGPLKREEIELKGVPLEKVLTRIKFLPPALDYENFREKFYFLDGNACAPCKRALAGGIATLSKHPEFRDWKNLTIVVGPQEKIPVVPTSQALLFGNCTYKYRKMGKQVPGCPPLASQAYQAILSIFSSQSGSKT